MLGPDLAMTSGMRRSPQPRVRSSGEVLFDAQRAQLLNLSRGGLCARGELPQRLGDSVEQRPEVRVALGLLDGRPPILAQAKLAWVRRGRDGENAPTIGMSFVDVSGDDQQRLDAAIAARVSDTPEPAMAEEPRGELRLRLADGATLRLSADSIDDRGLLVGAELPWLRVGARFEAEIDGVWRAARSSWVGLDVAPSGAARLRMRLELVTEEKREITRPYFFTGHETEAVEPEVASVRAELDAIPEGQEEAWARDKLGDDPVKLRVSAPSRGHLLVRLGLHRRGRLAMLRVAAVVLALGVLYGVGHLVAHYLQPRPKDVPIDVRPVTPTPTPAPLVESQRGAPIDELEVPAAKKTASHGPKPRAKKIARKKN
jgi:hypothetical protein